MKRYFFEFFSFFQVFCSNWIFHCGERFVSASCNSKCSQSEIQREFSKICSCLRFGNRKWMEDFRARSHYQVFESLLDNRAWNINIVWPIFTLNSIDFFVNDVLYWIKTNEFKCIRSFHLQSLLITNRSSVQFLFR